MLAQQFRDPHPSTARSSYGMKTMPLSLGNIILLKEKGVGGMRESFPRQVDKKSRGPQGGSVWNSQGERKDKLFFPFYIP